MSEVKFVLDLSPEDRALIVSLREAIGAALGSNCGKCADLVAGMCKTCTNIQQKDFPADVVPFPAAENTKSSVENTPVQDAPAAPSEAKEPEAAPVKTYTMAEVRKAVMNKSRQGNEVKARVKTILNKYADSVAALPAEKYSDFMAELEAM